MRHLNRALTTAVLLYTFFIFTRVFAVVLFVDDDAPGPGDRDTGQPFPTIQGAIDAAIPGDVIQVSPGFYSATSNRPVSFVGNRDAVAFMQEAVDVTGAGPGSSIIDGGGVATGVIFDGITTATISGFSIVNGSAYVGGGVLSVNSSPTITGSDITANQASGSGGGLFVGYGGSATISNNQFIGNSAPTGGAVAVIDGSGTLTGNYIFSNTADEGGGLFGRYSTLALSGNAIISNYATVADGGGVHTHYADLAIDGGNISFNSALVNGGGISIHGSTLGLSNITIEGNTASNGGGLEVYRYSAATLTNVVVDGNGSTFDGAGIEARNYSLLTITGGSSIINNVSGSDGGGIKSSRYVTLSVDGALISTNYASNRGGGIYGDSVQQTVANSTISGNTGNRGAGIYSNYSLDWISDNQIVSNTATSDGGGLYLYSSRSSVIGNDISDNIAGGSGGGAYVSGAYVDFFDDLSGFVTLSNNLITGNTSSSSFGGGGLYLYYLAHVSLTNNTIAANTALGGSSPGGGLVLNENYDVYLSNNIITSNIAGGSYGGGVYYGDPYSSYQPIITNNNIYGNSPDNWANYSSTPDPTGTYGNISVDPLFVDEPGRDFRLVPGSPAIDAGDNGAVALAGPDLDGNPRIADGDLVPGAVVDMGAYEVPFPAANSQPVAVAVSRFAFRDGDTVTLDGTRSFDPDGDPLTFQWSQTGGTPVTLDSTTLPTPTLTGLGTPRTPGTSPADFNALPASFFFDLTVSDGKSSDTARVEVRVAGAGTAVDVDLTGYRLTHELGVTRDPWGLEFSPDGSNLYILGGAETPYAGIFRGPVQRDGPTGRLVGFGPFQPDTLLPFGRCLTSHPSGTLFITTSSVPSLVQLPPSPGPQFEFDLNLLGVSVPTGLTFVPQGLPNAGTLLVVDLETTVIYSVSLSLNPDGTFTPLVATLFADLSNAGVTNPVGIAFVGDGSAADLLVNDSFGSSIHLVDIDPATGLPIGGAGAPSISLAYQQTSFSLDLTDAARDPLGDSILIANAQAVFPEGSILTFQPTPLDFDMDGVEDALDNCLTTPNASQLDTNTDGIGDACDRAVGNTPPVAGAGLDQMVDEGTLVTLDGTGSADLDLDPLTYAWTQTGGTPVVTLSDPGVPSPTFTAPLLPTNVSEVLTFELTVDDGFGPTAPDAVTITVNNVNVAPVASAGLDQTVDEGTLVTLDGTASSDFDVDPLIYAWTQTGGTPVVTLSDPGLASPTFTAPLVAATTDLTFSLTVNDGFTTSPPDTAVVTVLDLGAPGLPPTADAGPDRRGRPSSTVILDGSGSVDPDGAPLSYSWTQTAGPTAALSDPTSSMPAVDLLAVSPPALLTFELVVDDGIDGPSSPDLVNVQVVPPLEWHEFRHDGLHSGVTPSLGPIVGGSAFAVTFPAGIRSSVSFDFNDGMYVGSDDGNLYALELDGTVRWSFPTAGAVRTTPLVLADGTIVVGSFDGNLYAVNPDGSEKWRFSSGGKFRFSSPGHYTPGNLIIAGSEDGNVYGIDAATGSEVWRTVTGGAVHSSPAVADSLGWAYFGSTDGKLRGIDTGSGSVFWETNLGAAVQSAPSLDLILGYLFVGTDDGKLHAVNLFDGLVSWSFQTGAAVTSSPAVDAQQGRVYFGSDDFNLYALNEMDGSEVWRFATGSYVRSSPTVDGAGNIYVGSCNGNVYGVDPGGTELFRFFSSGLIIASPTVGSDGLAYIGSDDRFLYAVGPDPFASLPRAAPRLDEVTPASGIQGETLEATLRGANLETGIELQLGPGVVVDATEFLSATEMRLTLSIAPAAELGTRDVQATRLDGGLASTRLAGFEVSFDCRRADLTGDGMVDGLDLAVLATRFGSAVEPEAIVDLDGDGRVDGADLALLGSRFAQSLEACP